MTRLDEVGRLAVVALKHARDAFVSQEACDAQWRALRFTAAPDFVRAEAEYERFAELVQSTGARVAWLPPDPATTLDSIYVRDASIVTPQGLVLCSMGKRQRAGEPAAHARLGPAAGRIGNGGRLEGGDLLWLDPHTVAVGRGYRTNDEGIRQLRAALDPVIDVVTVPLPHWRGDGDVMHLMSLVSPVDRDLAVVFSPLMPVPFRELLLDRGLRLVEVPDDEFETMGCNVLALAPRRCLMLDGNPRTRAALERAGAEVLVYDGGEISIKGAGGPTCLTRPLAREPVD